MPHSLTAKQRDQLRHCLELAQDPAQHDQANAQFLQLLHGIKLAPATSELLEAVWNEMLAARRSSAFWQEISDVEKEMSDRLAQNHFQLQQNYLRLMQEQ